MKFKAWKVQKLLMRTLYNSCVYVITSGNLWLNDYYQRDIQNLYPYLATAGNLSGIPVDQNFHFRFLKSVNKMVLDA